MKLENRILLLREKVFLMIGFLIMVIAVLTSVFDRIYLEKFYIKSQKDNLYEVAERVKYQTLDLGSVNKEGTSIKVDMYLFDFIDLQLSALSEDDINELKELRKEPNEYIYKSLIDGEYESENLYLFTQLDEDRIISVSTPINSIADSLKIIGSFHRRLLLIIILISLLIGAYISKLISKPITKLSKIAEEYAQMDFRGKLDVNSGDEIGQLGRSINTMGYSLERNIRELEKANKKLIEDIEREQRIDKMRREFISNVSHELKTPIAIISNYIEGIKDGLAEDKDTLDFYLDIIDDETNSMNELVHKLLILSKLETKYDDLVIEELKLEELIEEELGKVSPILVEKGVKVDRKIDKEIRFNGDKPTIDMVMKNFVTNSAKYVNNGGRIEIVLKEEEGRKRFEIFNTMDGEIEELEKLWEPFYREDEARNREEGTGLGLSIVKEVLEKHNYDFGIIQDGGIRFWFEDVSTKK